MKPLLRLEGIVKYYGKRRVLNDIHIEVQAGEIVGLLGPNGAGKTTTFKIIIGSTNFDRGRVLFREEDVSNLPMYRKARLGVGYLAQETFLFLGLSVEDNLRAVLEFQNLNHHTIEEKIDSLLNEFGLQTVRKQMAYTLSGGEARRVEIARSLITNPKILLLDEPFSGVDPKTVSELQDLTKKLRDKGIGILLTDHNVRDTLAITDKSYVIDLGEILAQGVPEEILNNEIVRKRYLGEKFKM